MLPHPAAPNATDVVQSCPNKSAAGLICNKQVDTQQHHCYGCRYGRGVDRRHEAVARCLVDVIQSHSGTKVFIEQEVPALTRVVNGQSEHARMDLVFQPQRINHISGCLHCCSFLLQSVDGLSSQHPTKKSKCHRCPHINLVPFILEITGGPGPHARKFISYLLRDADNPPLAIRDTWSAIQKCAPHSHPQTTTHSRRHVISSDQCQSQFIFSASCYHMQVPS